MHLIFWRGIKGPMEKDIDSRKLDIEGHPFSRKELEEIWKTLTDKPLPKITAIPVETKEFYRVLGVLKIGDHVIDLLEWEYGREGLRARKEAFVYALEESYLICIDKGGSNSIEENLKHELNHIIHNAALLTRKR